MEPVDVPTEGVLLAATSASGAAVGLAQLGDVVAPVLLEEALADGSSVHVVARGDGLLVARRARGP